VKFCPQSLQMSCWSSAIFPFRPCFKCVLRWIFCLGGSRSWPAEPVQTKLNSWPGFLRLLRRMNPVLSCQTRNQLCCGGQARDLGEPPCLLSCKGPRHPNSSQTATIAEYWNPLADGREPGRCRRRPHSRRCIQLESPDVLGLPALWSLHHVELDRLAFLKRTKSFTLDG